LKNYYKILRVSRSDSSATIKRVFRKLALELHPDINTATNAHEQFVELNEAYEVLRNPVKRKRYNQLLNSETEKKQTSNKAEKRKKKWNSSTQNSVTKGKARGNKYASETGKKFKKRTDSWASNFWGEVIIEVTFRALGAIFEGIFDF